jgi:hypothetical protein
MKRLWLACLCGGAILLAGCAQRIDFPRLRGHSGTRSVPYATGVSSLLPHSVQEPSYTAA